MSEFYGTAEVAVACGVTQQAVSNWLARGQMPEPAFRLRMGPVWSVEDPKFARWLGQKEPDERMNLVTERETAVADHDELIAQAGAALAHPGPLAGAEERVPDRPGLYAIYADAPTWHELGLGSAPDGRPLYVGKAADSLITRNLETHFGDGRTGHSTVRRSLAALLHDDLHLRGIPRNPEKPGHFSNYALSPAHDGQLTRWMLERLQLAVWPKPTDCAHSLREIETALILDVEPPLNLTHVVTPWTSQVKAARAVMAAEARAWAQGAQG